LRGCWSRSRAGITDVIKGRDGDSSMDHRRAVGAGGSGGGVMAAGGATGWRRPAVLRGGGVVAPHGSAVAGPARGARPVEDGVQSLRSVVPEGPVGRAVVGAADRCRHGMAEHRQHDEPGPPARRGWKRGARSPRDRALARWCDDEGTPRSRRAWPATRLRGHRGTAPRHRAGAWPGGPNQAALPARRQGLQHARFPRASREHRLPARDAVVERLDRPARVRQGSLQGALGGRVHVQPAQAGSPLRDSLREDAAQLRCRRRHRVRAAVAAALDQLQL